MSSQQQPKPDDAVLGGQSRPAMDALVLGGIEGLQQRFELGNDDEKRQALKELKQYGDRGLVFLLDVLHENVADSIKQSAIKHLQDFDLKNNKLERTINDALIKLASDRNYLTRQKLASIQNCPVEILEKLACDNISNVLKAVASNLNCPAIILQKLSLHRCQGVRDAVHKNPNCSIDLIRRIIFYESALNKNKILDLNCPVYLLKQLASDKSSEVRSQVAANPNCPVDLLEQLASDESNQVRSRLADNPNCPVDLLEKLASDESSEVRIRLAQNCNCPRESLYELLFGEYVGDIDKAVVWNDNCPVELLQLICNPIQTISGWTHTEVAYNINCPQELLQQLFSLENSYLYYDKIVWNPNCPLEILNQLASDEHSSIRLGVIENPKCPVETLQKLAYDEDERVRNKAKLMLQRFS
jgi:hypothetical protein